MNLNSGEKHEKDQVKIVKSYSKDLNLDILQVSPCWFH